MFDINELIEDISNAVHSIVKAANPLAVEQDAINLEKQLKRIANKIELETEKYSESDLLAFRDILLYVRGSLTTYYNTLSNSQKLN